jgi:succinoglycan biosynthesis transport protein ExoP
LDEEFMGSTGRRYSDEFKIKAVRMTAESDRPLVDVADELGVSERSLRRWRLGLDSILGESESASDEELDEGGSGHGTGQRYSTEFKRKAVRMARESDRSVADTARELGVSASTLWRWRLEFDVEPGRPTRALSETATAGDAESEEEDEPIPAEPEPEEEAEPVAAETAEETQPVTAEVEAEEQADAVTWETEPAEETQPVTADVQAEEQADAVTWETEPEEEAEPVAAETAEETQPVTAEVEAEEQADAVTWETEPEEAEPVTAEAEPVEEATTTTGEAVTAEPEGEGGPVVDEIEHLVGQAPEEPGVPVSSTPLSEPNGWDHASEWVLERPDPDGVVVEGADGPLEGKTNGALTPALHSTQGRRRRVSAPPAMRQSPFADLPPAVDPPAKNHDAIELSEIAGILKRRAWVVVGAAAASVAIAAVVALQEIPRYRATAVLRVAAEGREAVTQGFEAPTRESDRFVNTLLSQMQLLRSRSLIGDVVDSVGFRLHPDYATFDPRLLRSARVAAETSADTLWLEFDPAGYTARTRRGEARALYGQPAAVDGVELVVAGQPEASQAVWTIYSQQEAVDRLLTDLRTAPRSETNIVDVSFVHPNPAQAQSVANTLVTRYQEFEAQFAQERARRRRIFLEEQVAQTDSSLARARAGLRGFQTRAQTYDARQELSSQQQNRMALDIRRSELDAERRMYQGLLDQLETTTDPDRSELLRTLVSAPGIAENAAVSRIHEQLLRQREVLDSLTTGDFASASTHPDVVRQRQLIANSEDELAGAIRSHVASLDARADALTQLSARTTQELSSLPSQLAEETRLAQIVQTYQKVSDQVREELQRARVAEAATVGQADIIDLAGLPYEPEPGTYPIKIALGLFLGLILGVGAAFLLERRNRSVQSRAEVEDAFRMPVLGLIPRATVPDLAELKRKLSLNGKVVELGTALNGSVRRSSHAMEAYRLLRTNILFAGWTGQVRNIVVTSTSPREGKTLTAASLAASIAEEGVRVLLVDADLWRGRIHEIPEVPESPGLSDLLAGRTSPELAVRRTGMTSLDLLPRGTWQADPSALTSAGVLERVLDDLGRGYDIVVIDGPPVLAAGSAPVLPAIADGVLFLVRAGQTDRGALREALRQLGAVGARVLGVVLNDPDNVSSAVEGHYYYEYEYAARKA